MAGRSEPRAVAGRAWPALLALAALVAAMVLLGLNKDPVAEASRAVLPWPPVVAGVLTALPAALVAAGFAAVVGSGWRRWVPLALTLPFLPLLLLGMPGRRTGGSADRERLLEVATERDWAAAVMDGALAGFGTLVVLAVVLLAATRWPRLPVRPLSAALVAAATLAIALTHGS